jgi:CheY-like chemotaxis protein
MKEDNSPLLSAVVRRGVPSASHSNACRRRVNAAPRARVLIVDDEVRLREGLAGLLRKEHIVHSAGSALHALECLRSGAQFDVILTDVMMPGTSGVELYEAIVQEFPSYAERVVFMTGAVESSHDHVLGLPNLCLRKPLDLGLLRGIIGRSATTDPGRDRPRVGLKGPPLHVGPLEAIT